MAAREPSIRAFETVPDPRSLILASVALLLVFVAGLDKVLLFRNLEYTQRDLYAFLEMTWSWLYSGHLLHDNVFGDHGAIHNFYLMPAFAPLTIPLGAYGLVVGLAVVHAVAVLRVARSRAFDLSGQLTILAAALGPVAFSVFDNPVWGFHPELLYPPLALWLAVELLEGWTWRALAVTGAIVLVKEDGAVVCAAVVLAHTAWRVLALRAAPKDDMRRALRSGLVSLLVLTVLFAAGLALLFWMSEAHAGSQETFAARVGPSLRVLARTLEGHGRARLPRLQDSVGVLVALSLLWLVPLGRRLPRGLVLFASAVPPLVVVLLVSAAGYRFHKMLWAPRVATLMTAAMAALVFASARLPRERPARAWIVVGLAAFSWCAQVGLLRHMSYPIGSRLSALASVAGPPRSALSAEEDRVLRCVARRLPSGLPVSAADDVYPLFHRQSVVFEDREEYAWHAPRLRVVPASDESGLRAETPCRGPEVGSFAVEVECALLPLVRACVAP